MYKSVVLFLTILFMSIPVVGQNTESGLKNNEVLFAGYSSGSLFNEYLHGFNLGYSFYESETPAKSIYVGIGMDATCLFGENDNIAFMFGMGPNVVWIPSGSYSPVFSFSPQLSLMSCDDVNSERISAVGIALAMDVEFFRYGNFGLNCRVKPFVGFDYNSKSGTAYHLMTVSAYISYSF